MSYILIVDDDEDLTNAVCTVLRKEGYEVESENDCSKTLKRLESRRPDLLILDIMFPEDASAGFDIARLIRKEKKYDDLPVLMLTAVNEKYPFGFSAADIDEQWMPVSDFLEKPVEFDLLKKRVNELLGRNTDFSSNARTV